MSEQDDHRPGGFRSAAWFGPDDRNGFMHRSWMKNQGTPDHMFDGRPVIGICNTWSELTPCNGHFRHIAEHVKRGVLEAGGFPVEFPVMSLGETLLRPTAMLFRNLASMEVEETIRANPIDGVVLLCGCDKTTPALVMGAASCDLPTIVVSGGPMLNGKYRGSDIGSGTNLFSMSEDARAGRMTRREFMEAESCMSRSPGHCMTMGTASTMASMVEALGLTLPQNAAIPAVDSRRLVLAQDSGRRIVEMVREDLRLSKILDRRSFENAIRVNAAIGGSTNAVIHLLAMAGRCEIALTLDDFDRIGREVPLLVDLMPSGRFLMEDFYYAGGLPVVLRRLGGLLHGDARTVSGKALAETFAEAPCWNDEVIRPLERPVREKAGIAVLRGNLAPNGAIIKPSAASPALLVHRGRAIVFEGLSDFRARIDDPALDVDESSVLVMRGVGLKGHPGMPEVGNMPLPRKLLERGVRDMVRLSDARMSGTAYGTVILHVAPEAAAGGPLALVETGDMIAIDVPNGRLHLDVSDATLAARRQRRDAPSAAPATGYERLYLQHIMQPDTGADFDFLVGRRGPAVADNAH
ncbi:IlvD/Edd family dehydratase [Chelatococcus asaccharovorans]|uniref:Dihydroxyacid dehydratase n=1 Tax=Chelatococcus asaccharovorans TaxID=28210 RepID=A0A2V3TUW3_9HYPH|nr:IlvD/Edd family dehydratase [Chelatococcus asaccharovorans]MBS7706173.1 dihydroxy-acid dehydratase [Chelatococcus asaccharovorans]PXW52549.1 dihydroxyacid dehydratase [Chelatococcus asaccharovorans]